MPDQRSQAIVLLEIQGVLSQTLPEAFRDRIPAILARRRDIPVQLLLTTEVDRVEDERLRQGVFFSPARDGQLTRFTWKARGPLDAVLRRFRLEFLRHLGPSDSGRMIYMSIVTAEDAFGFLPSRAFEPNPPTAGTSSAPPPRVEPAVPACSPVPEPPPAAAPLPPLAAPKPERRAESPEPTPLPGNFYQDWFGFAIMPFNNTPDPRFFLPTEKHQEALSRLIYAVSERKGFVMISGEIGSGKSTICRTLLTQLPKTVRTALITHTHVNGEQLVRAIAEDLGLEPDGHSKLEVLRKINEYLVEQLAQGAIVCVIIDEAQNLSAEALEEVRMISNLETEQEKLVQLILLGQPELRDKILLPELKQLRQRIAVQFHLEPLSQDETLTYIRHRLRVANPTESLHFKTRAMIEAHRYSGGVPRLINILCDNALLTLYTRQERVVTPKVIREAARDLNIDRVLSGGWFGFLDAW